jgi:hypothetical protein
LRRFSEQSAKLGTTIETSGGIGLLRISRNSGAWKNEKT